MSNSKHENFKKLDANQQRLIVGRVKKLYDAGIGVEEVATGLNKEVALIEEVFDILDTAKAWAAEHGQEI